MGEPEWQDILGARRGRRHQAGSPHRLAALPVEQLALGEIALGGGRHFGAIRCRRAGRLAAQRRRSDADAELEADWGWNGRHRAAISPLGLVVTPYWAKQAAAYSVGARKVT